MAERRRTRQQAHQTPLPVGQIVAVPLHWQSEPQVPVLFANQVALQVLEDQLVIMFGIVKQPLQPPTEELTARLKIEGLPVVPVAQVVMGRHKVKELIEAFTDLERQLNAQNQEGGQPR